MRTAGILMPITSLPSPYGVGTLGQCARDFIQFLHRAGQTYWQILPICPTGYGDSPYQSFSSYAGNPYMIDFDDLKKEGLLQEEEYASISWGDNPARVDYSLLYSHKFSILRIACSRISGVLSERFQTFCKEQNVWLNDYALYMSIKDYYGGQSWQEWPETLQKREKDSLEAIRQELTDEILFWKKVQFLFFYQWDKLKAYAEENNIKIIGDLPIYVSYDSADVWAHPEEFQNNAIRYLRLTKEEGYHIGMMRCAWASVANTAIMQMQDFLGLGVEGRMNTPSTLGGNWTWRCLPGDYNNELADWLYEETKIYDRLN